MSFGIVFTDHLNEITTLRGLAGQDTARKTFFTTNSQWTDSTCLDAPFQVVGVFPGRVLSPPQIVKLEKYNFHNLLKALYYNMDEQSFTIWSDPRNDRHGG